MSRGQVHVVDDETEVREALSALFRAAGYAARGFASAAEFLGQLETLPPGCVVADVHMPEITGLELLRRLGSMLARFPVIVLTGRADVPMAVEALKLGAADFIEKPFDPGQMLSAVEAALQRAARDAAELEAQERAAGRLAALTARERDVLRGLMAGASNKEIARELALSPRTVENYRASIMVKAQVQSFSELVRTALMAETGGARG